MKHLIYSPQPNATPDEIMQVLKVFTVYTLPNVDERTVMTVYDSLSPEAKRHFTIKEVQ